MAPKTKKSRARRGSRAPAKLVPSMLTREKKSKAKAKEPAGGRLLQDMLLYEALNNCDGWVAVKRPDMSQITGGTRRLSVGNVMGAAITAKTPRARMTNQSGSAPACLSRNWSTLKDQTSVGHRLEHLQSVATQHMNNLSQIQSQADSLAAKSLLQQNEIALLRKSDLQRQGSKQCNMPDGSTEMLKKSAKRIEMVQRPHPRLLPMSNILLPISSNSPMPMSSSMMMPNPLDISIDQPFQSQFTRHTSKDQPLAPMSSSLARVSPENGAQHTNRGTRRASQRRAHRRLSADDWPAERVCAESSASVHAIFHEPFFSRTLPAGADQHLTLGNSEAEKVRSKSEVIKPGILQSLRSTVLSTPPLKPRRHQGFLGTLAGRYAEEVASEDKIAEAEQAWQISEVAESPKLSPTISGVTPLVVTSEILVLDGFTF